MEGELKTLLKIIAGQSELAASERPPLREALSRLDAIAADGEADLDPHLRHYLEKRSYAKALAFLRDA